MDIILFSVKCAKYSFSKVQIQIVLSNILMPFLMLHHAMQISKKLPVNLVFHEWMIVIIIDGDFCLYHQKILPNIPQFDTFLMTRNESNNSKNKFKIPHENLSSWARFASLISGMWVLSMLIHFALSVEMDMNDGSSIMDFLTTKSLPNSKELTLEIMAQKMVQHSWEYLLPMHLNREKNSKKQY